MDRQSFKTYLNYYWYWYVIVAVLTIFAYFYLFKLLNLPGYDESIYVFIESSEVKKEELSTYLFEDLKTTNIKQVSIDYSNPDDFYYQSVFNTRGMVNTDLLIISEDYIKSGAYHTYFAPFNLEELANYMDVSKQTFYKDSDNLTYGILMDDYLNEYIAYKEDQHYYLFMNKNSNKIGEFCLKEKQNDHALTVLAKMVEKAS